MYDVIAVGNAAATMAATEEVTPLLEPMKAGARTLMLRAPTFASAGLQLGLIMNPKVGDLVGQVGAPKTLLTDLRKSGVTVSPALILDGATLATEIATFQKHVLPGGDAIFVHQGVPGGASVVSSIQGIKNANHVFIEGMTGAVHQKVFSPRGLIRDGFKVQPNNVSYPAQSFFSDLHLTYSKAGFTSFGDYVTVGQMHRVGGGLPRAVVIHMTEETPAGILCHHFKSTTNATNANPAGKFGEAAAALRAYCKKHPGKLDFTAACQELLVAEAQGHFPGLASVKRLSIQHHLELMSSLL